MGQRHGIGVSEQAVGYLDKLRADCVGFDAMNAYAPQVSRWSTMMGGS